jgi:DNA-binding NarL/FixJ family response regulator
MDLSTREFEIFCLLAEGVSSADIAKRLSLSQKTVANYGTQLKTKLNVASVAELTRLAIRHGILAA